MGIARWRDPQHLVFACSISLLLAVPIVALTLALLALLGKKYGSSLVKFLKNIVVVVLVHVAQAVCQPDHPQCPYLVGPRAPAG